MSATMESTLVGNMEHHRNFHYPVAAVEAPVPMFGGRSMSRQIDIYFRLGVFTQTGTEGYDLVGLTQQHSRSSMTSWTATTHVGFLHYSSEHDHASVRTPPVAPVTDTMPQMPRTADNVETLDDE